MAGAPLVSVVVPTHNRPERLARLLRSLEDQSLGAERFEVIVVDDASETMAEEVVARCAPRLRVRCLRQPRPLGPAAARNRGWRSAAAPLVAFTDDDCRAEPGWLEAAVRAAREHPDAVLQGRTEPDPEEPPDEGLLRRTVCVRSLGPQYQTCNIFYPRSALQALGGFDERFGRRPAAEDTDLAWRALERGWRAVFVPDAVILHAVEETGVGGSLALARRWGPAVRVFAAHPGARAILYRGVFWNVWHYLLWRSLASLAGPRWLRRIVLTRHLLALRRRAAARRASAWGIPFLLVHDAVECWAVAAGALRHRTLVL